MECEQPNANLYSFNGNLLLLKRQFQEQESVRSKTSKGEEPSTSESLSRRLGAAVGFVALTSKFRLGLG